MPLIDKLPDGPLDVIGDIHGEIEALEHLLQQLGYENNGNHPSGRSLVFVGDLVDRGPDSPAVVNKVASLVAAGQAQCVLGNHELNLLRESSKNDNDWWINPDVPARYPAVNATDEFKARARRFFESLPLVLERDGLRIVHASWHDDSIRNIRSSTGSVVEVYKAYADRAAEELAVDGTDKKKEIEKKEFGKLLKNQNWKPTILSAHARSDAVYQMRNPVRVITSGQETPTDKPFWASGKWRMLERLQWWDSYDEPDQPVIMGHYWRQYDPLTKQLDEKQGPNLFAGQPPDAWVGKHNNVYCVDFSVGARFQERMGNSAHKNCKLAAMRVPEWIVMFDDGEELQLPPPGRQT